jgi:hypothetical protein
MAQSPRIVAELGRAETPDETAARKAESSRVYRASQNTRNLVAALIVTIAVNVAAVEGEGPRAWTLVYADETWFLRIAQGFDADPAWPTRMLSGASIDGTVTVDGVQWDRYDIADPARAGNISVALATQAGDDTILIYGRADQDTLEQAAAAAAPEVERLRDEYPSEEETE